MIDLCSSLINRIPSMLRNVLIYTCFTGFMITELRVYVTLCIGRSKDLAGIALLLG